MSELGSVSVKVWREAKFIEELNDALLVIEANLIGKSLYFDFSEEDVSKSRDFILNFIKDLNLTIKNEELSIELHPIVVKIEESNKPKQDWIEDLEKLSSDISSENVSNKDLNILEDIFSLLDNQFTKDLQHLYAH